MEAGCGDGKSTDGLEIAQRSGTQTGRSGRITPTWRHSRPSFQQLAGQCLYMPIQRINSLGLSVFTS